MLTCESGHFVTLQNDPRVSFQHLGNKFFFYVLTFIEI